MSAAPVDLTLEIRSQDGSCTEFFQDQEDSVHKTLRLLATPRLFAQPLLVLASPHSLSAIPCRTVDMLLARTSASVLLRWPRGLADIVEVPNHHSADSPSANEAMGGEAANAVNTATMLLHVYTSGGWAITLELTRAVRLTVPDERVLLAHILDLPILPFRLATGGIGLINPSKIIRATGRPSAKDEPLSKWPDFQALPATALPVQLLRWTPRLRPDGAHPRESSQAITQQFRFAPGDAGS